MSDDLEFIVIDDIPEYIFCIGDDEENEQVIALSGKDGAFKYEKVDELPTAGEDGVLYLVPKSHTTQTASGNPITATITDDAGQMESFQLDGDTFQQSYTGKNLCDGTIYKTGYIINTQGEEMPSNNAVITNAVQVEPNTTYTASIAYADSSPDKYLRVAIYTSDMTFISRPSSLDVGEPVTFTTPSNARYIRLAYYAPATNAQLELGSTATSYEPFVGGQPSPSPEYTQQIQTVTGTQTISINGTNYPISLGSLELCKLGTYKDYIYKDGDSWKVHKATDYVTIDSLSDGNSYSINTNSTNTTRVLINGCLNLQGIYDPVEVRSLAKCNYFVYESNWGSDTVGFFTDTDAQATKNGLCFRAPKTVVGTTEETVETWLNDHPLKVNYILLTPTDTTITDTTLIAQLEAIRTAALESGSNTISNTAASTNLAGDLEIGYYSYDPLNKYDKYFWLDVDGEYESI